MTTHRPFLTVVAICNLLAVSAQAQTSPAPTDRRATPTGTATATGSADQSLASSATAGLRHAATTAGPSRNTFTAAGNVVVLADGIVADARMVPMPPPAAGFQYER